MPDALENSMQRNTIRTLLRQRRAPVIFSLALMLFHIVSVVMILLSVAARKDIGNATDISSAEEAESTTASVHSGNLAFLNTAERLQKRIVKHFGITMPLSTLMRAVETRRTLLHRSLIVTLKAGQPDGKETTIEWATEVPPEWVVFEKSRPAELFSISEDSIASTLPMYLESILPSPSIALFSNVRQDYRVQKGIIEGTAHEGYLYDVGDAAGDIVAALKHGDERVEVRAEHQPAMLLMQTASGVIALQRIAQGRSNFARSPSGRISNIKTALEERLNGVMIESDQHFSFNSVLVGARYWANALVIVNGKDLVYEPGGGICQASTTVFRAALLAGLPVQKRKNHSLYVSYYEKYGVGIDATVYSGRQDFTFVNDTGSPLVIASRTEGDDAYVDIYGIPDGRTVRIEGPFFAGSDHVVQPMDGKNIQRNEIVWTSDVTYANGIVRPEVIRSRYLALPKNIAKKFPEPMGIVELTGDPTLPQSQPPIVTASNDQL